MRGCNLMSHMYTNRQTTYVWGQQLREFVHKIYKFIEIYKRSTDLQDIVLISHNVTRRCAMMSLIIRISHDLLKT